ncbi:hypothetical protein ACFVSK_01670 [Cellulosimicrobium cellulans]|uniref:hypothetical protein n=1 Tax=Cellulosimicrobium TaxID=157920 RepID=UPI0012E7F27B|nr:hypothetical protein [Cellulosimicrobium sp. I38E]
MDQPEIGLRRLGAAQTKDQVVDALWDLRDSSYDHPERWNAFTAEAFFQRLAEELEAAPGDGGAALPAELLARAVERTRDYPSAR